MELINRRQHQKQQHDHSFVALDEVARNQIDGPQRNHRIDQRHQLHRPIGEILIEAAATALASIVSGHPGCREIVEDGVTGRILSATSDIEMSKEMSGAVTRYLENPELLASHQQAAYRHFLSREFNQDAVANRFTELLGFPLSPSRNRSAIALGGVVAIDRTVEPLASP